MDNLTITVNVRSLGDAKHLSCLKFNGHSITNAGVTSQFFDKKIA